MSTQTVERITPSQYLARERKATYKSEYLNGEVHPMAGASRIHVLICINLLTLLKIALRGSECQCYHSDLRVRVSESFVYPDVTVTCGEEEYLDSAIDTLLNPMLLIEVLSPSTEEYDRGPKFEAYRSLPSLREYLLVAQDRHHVELFRLNDAGRWELFEVSGLESSIELTSVGCTLSLAEIYENVEMNRA